MRHRAARTDACRTIPVGVRSRRAIVSVSYGHDYGVASFVDALATVPIALVTAALAFGGGGPTM